MNTSAVGANIVDVTEANIRETVIDTSNQIPVLVDFWADWCEPCKALTPILEKLAQEYNGRFLLAKINADEQQGLAGQFGVRSLPTLKLVVQGQIAEELVGLQSESAVRALIDKYLPRTAKEELEDLIEKINELRTLGEVDKVQALLKQAIATSPDDEKLKLLYADVLIDLDEIDDAKTIVDSLSPDSKEGPLARSFFARLSLLEEVKKLPSTEELEAKLQKTPDDLDAQLQLAMHCGSLADYDRALTLLWTLFSQHGKFKTDEVKSHFLNLLEVLGKKDPRAIAYRKKMFSFLH